MWFSKRLYITYLKFSLLCQSYSFLTLCGDSKGFHSFAGTSAGCRISALEHVSFRDRETKAGMTFVEQVRYLLLSLAID